jgi:membrane protein XagC
MTSAAISGNGGAAPAAVRVPTALAAAPIAALAFVTVLVLAAAAMRHGLIAEDVLRLWAGASAAADGQMPIGRVVAAYPMLPFVSTALVAWLAPADAPAPLLVAAALLAFFAASCFVLLRKADWPPATSVFASILVAMHPALLRAAIAGPGEMFLAVFLLMFCLALYRLRARSGTAEVMNVGLALMALFFAHPLGAAFAFASVPLLAFAVRPVLVADSPLNVLIALVFPTLFAVAAFAYLASIFPGDGWTLLAAPAASSSLWTAALARVLGGHLTLTPIVDAAVAIAIALAAGAPAALYLIVLVRRRRPLVVPALVFAGAVVIAACISMLGSFFGDPAALVVAAPVLVASVVIRVAEARARPAVVIGLLLLGWCGGLLSMALADPITVSHLRATFVSDDRDRADALAAGGASAGRDGVLADVNNAPAFVVGRSSASGLLGPQSEPFSLSLLFDRIDAPFVAVPDPHSHTGVNDRLDLAFPSLFGNGLDGYRLIYQNKTWRLFGRLPSATASRK